MKKVFLSAKPLVSRATAVFVLFGGKIPSTPEWRDVLTPEDKRALNVLFHSHINPYGLFPLNLSKRLGITGDALEMDNYNENTVLAKEAEEEVV